MTRDQLISLFFLALLIFVIREIFLIFSPFFGPLFWSALLAFAFYPIFQGLKKMLKIHETLAAAGCTLAIFLIITPPLVILIVNLTGQAIELYQRTAGYIREGHLEKLIDDIRTLPWIQKIQAEIFQWDPIKKNASDWLLGSARRLTNLTASQVGLLTKNIFFVVLNFLLVVFLTFVFLKDGEKIYDFIFQIAPMEERNKRYVFGQINETFSAVLRGQILTSMTQAVVAGVFFWVLGLPVPIFFAAATFLAGLIPVVGASSIWGPLVVYLYLIHEQQKAIILFLFGFLVISLIDNFMKPALIGEKTKLPYFLLFFGILGGIRLYGLIGIFLAPVLLSLFFALVKIYQEQFLSTHRFS